MQEGEPGDAMYVIKSGKLEVYVGGSLTRHVGRGCAVGELALLYHTPRSASVKVRNLGRPGPSATRRGCPALFLALLRAPGEQRSSPRFLFR